MTSLKFSFFWVDLPGARLLALIEAIQKMEFKSLYKLWLRPPGTGLVGVGPVLCPAFHLKHENLLDDYIWDAGGFNGHLE